MIPLRDTIRSRHAPVMTWLLIAANVFVFLFESILNPAALERLSTVFGLVPASLSTAPWLFVISLFTSMFLHGGWFHLLSNMLALFIFGDNVEDRMGPLGFLVFYLSSGVVAGLLQTFSSLGSLVPVVGASGAIAGVLGAYMLLYPRARVVTLIPIFIFPWFIEVPALLYLGFWFISQLFSGVAAIGAVGGGVAWWAHVGGFLFGLLVAPYFLFRSPPASQVFLDFPPDDPYRSRYRF